MAQEFTSGRFKSWLDSGAPNAGGRLYTYASGTTTFKAAYTDSTLATPCTYTSDGVGGQYIALNSRGETQVWLGSGSYTFKTQDTLGVTVESTDGIGDPATTVLSTLASSSNGSGADLVGGVGRVCDTVAAMLALPVTKAGGSQRAFALGYRAPGGHGGGQFYYDPSDTTSTVNGGTIFASTSGGTGRWKRIFAGDLFDTWFGANVDGSDDSAYVQAMLNSVVNPSQTVCRLISGSRQLHNITVPQGCWLTGTGKDSCTVSTTDLANPVFLLNSYTRLEGFQVTHPNQTITGPTPTVYPPAITHAPGGCSYVTVKGIRLYNAYDGIVLGSSTAGVGGINIDDIDGFPLHYGIVIDSCNEVSRIDRVTFNLAFVGSIYTGNVIPGWVLQNGIGIRILRADSGSVDTPLILGYKRAMTFEAGAVTGSANMWTIKSPIFDLCLAPVETINYQDGITFLGGSMTGANGYLSLTGTAMPLGGGAAINQCVKFIGTIFRNFYDGIATCSTNVDFIDCELYNYNNHNAAPVGAIAIGANNVRVRVNGGRIDGASRANSRGVDNQSAFTGVTLDVGGVAFSNMGSSAIYAPTGTTLLLGKCTGLGAIFYNGLNPTQNNQGEMMVGAIPAAGTWTQDTRFLRSSATVGSPKAWTCTVGGTPGTWVSEGNL
jgi:hypothetical protein